MQSVEQIETICYQNILNEVEAYMNEQDRETTAEECLARCIHASACMAIHLAHTQVYDMTKEETIADFLEIGKCDECIEYEE